jgi:uncharacterized membrane protein YedE/YeeE
VEALFSDFIPTSVAAAAVATTTMQFTPVTALVGGLTLGIAAVAKYAITGRVLGISGAFKGFVQGHTHPWRVLFTAGLVGGAFVAKSITPEAFDLIPATFTVTRGAVGGFLVGLGAALGNGCTSGHGICGNARLSVRSMFYTAVFMATGMAAATLAQTAAALGIVPTAATLAMPSSEVANSGALLAATALLTFLGLARTAQAVKEPKSVELLTELAAGAFFAFGLVYTGMVRPTKVAAFLSPTYPAWDLSLMFVMGGALLVALPGFQTIISGKALAKPCACDKFDKPKVTAIDMRLAVGGVLFGAGWGISGMCPGPAVVAAVATPVAPVLAYVGAMMAGMWVQGVLAPKNKAVKPATA